MGNQKLTITVSALTDLIITAGGCITTAMVATGSTTMPSKAVWVFALVTGAVAGARKVQALLNPIMKQKKQQ